MEFVKAVDKPNLKMKDKCNCYLSKHVDFKLGITKLLLSLNVKQNVINYIINSE